MKSERENHMTEKYLDNVTNTKLQFILFLTYPLHSNT